MKIKTLQKHFRRARFDWTVVERKRVEDAILFNPLPVCVRHKFFGLFRQDKHWVVAEIYNDDISDGCDNQLEFDKVERLSNLKTYMPNEEALARKEYESK